VTGYLAGWKICFLMALALFPVNLLYLSFLGQASASFISDNIPGAAGAYFAGVLAGYVGELQTKANSQLEQLNKEKKERIKAQEELFHIQNLLQYNLYNEQHEVDHSVLQKLQITNNTYREIAENAVDIIYITDLKGNIIYVNKAGTKVSGYSTEELMNVKYHQLISPEYMHLVKRFYLMQLKEKKATAYLEIPVITKDRKQVWLGQNATLIYNDDTVCGLSVIARNITEKKKFEAELKEKEERLQLITESASDAIITTDSHYNIIQWNHAAEQIYGYTEPEILGKPVTLLMREEDKNQGILSIEEYRSTYDLKKPYEQIAKRKDGTFFTIEMSITDWKTGGEIFRTHIIRDVSARKEAEQKLKQSEKDYRLLFMSAHEPILVIRPEDEVILEANDKACEVYGYSRPEFIGLSLKGISDDVNRGEQKIIETLNAGNIINFQTVQFRKDGRKLFLEVNASTIEYKGKQAILSINRDITGKLEAEKSLRLLLAAIENTSEMITLHDFENKMIFANKAFLETFGYREEEVLGKIPDLISKDLNLSGIKEVLVKTSHNGHWSGNVYAQKKDGKKFLISLNTSYVVEPKTDTRAVIAVGRDITKEIEAREKLKESEERYRKQRDRAQKYMDISPVLMCVLDTAGNITMMNETGCKIIGFTQEEVKGKNWVNLCFKKEMREEMDKILFDIMNRSSSKFEYFENTIVTNSGEEKILAFHNTAIVEEDSGVSGILFSGEDITERKKDEKVIHDYKNHLEQLVSERTARLQQLNAQLFMEYRKLSEADERIQNQNEFFKTLINTMPLPVFIRDKNMIFIECNLAFEKFFGITKSELAGKTAEEIFSKNLAELLNKDQVPASGSVDQQFESDIIDKYGSLHEVIIYQALITKKDGSSDGSVAVLLDITSQKILQRETTRSLEKEKELNELKSGFISMASHEFRTPLTTILASADLLEILGPKWDEERYKKHLLKIQNAVVYMTELIDDVLLINKAETGKMSFIPVGVNLVNIIKETIENFRVTAGENFNFTFKIDSVRDTYTLDLKLVTQIVTNLISNAVKYSPAGGDITVTLAEKDSILKFGVSDKGLGIQKEDLKHLFQPFHRGKNIKNIPGTGLGLSIVQKAVEMHDGKIFVESVPGKGSDFTIFLPVIDNQK
jgi:PAS domain S-box-containing protein